MRSRAARILEDVGAHIGSDASGIQSLSVFGSPARVILKHSDDYDLVVIGSKGLGAGDVGLGPVASRVVEHISTPVLVGRDLKSDLGSRILIAADGSAANHTALRTLMEHFDLQNSTATLLHVTETPWVHLAADENWTTFAEEEQERSEAGVFEKELTREGESIIEETRTLLRGSGIGIDTSLVEGNPADEILSEAERGQYDLIVMGASDNRDVKHSMLGSVSAKVAWNAPCSVLIVRESA